MSITLDSSQRQFCESPDKNIRLLAPAGCGKTISLLFRCAYLAEKANPQRLRFLILTFTRVAQQELRSRLNEDNTFESLRDQIEIITLNSWGNRRIKNIVSSPKIINTNEDLFFTMRNQLRPIWIKPEYEKVKTALEGKKKNTRPKKMMEIIDSFKSIGFDHIRQTNYEEFVTRLNELRSQGLTHKLNDICRSLVELDVITPTNDDDSAIYNNFFQFWREATAQLISSATFTLEDQKYVAYLDERQKLDERKHLSGAARYDHILVDEFQDINPLDLALLKAIVQRNRANITIVGDDDQALFEWRGATPEYILKPQEFFEMDFFTHILATNYRSPSNIVEMSQRLIARNSRRVKKTIHAARTDDALVEVKVTENLNKAMEQVHTEIQNFIAGGNNPARVAIIGRKKSQLIPYQIFFASNNVPFCAAEDLQVFMSKAFERILSLITIKTRYDDRGRKTEVVNDILELCDLVQRYPLRTPEKQALRQYLSHSEGLSTVSQAVESLELYRGSLRGEKANSKGKISLAMADSIRCFLHAESVAESIRQLGEKFSGLQIDLGKAEDDIFYVDPPFLHLAEYAIRYGKDYDQFIEDVDRAKEQLAHIPPVDDDQPSSLDELLTRPVHLMTAIRSKGKEFDSVILLDVNDDIWPNKNAETPEEREAERRVFYVAFTRARRKVLILVSKRFGNRDAIPSRFLAEMDLNVTQ